MAGCNCQRVCNLAAVPRLGLQRRLYNTPLSQTLRNTQCVHTKAGRLSRGVLSAEAAPARLSVAFTFHALASKNPACLLSSPVRPCPTAWLPAHCRVVTGCRDTDPIRQRPRLPLQRQVASRHQRTCTCSPSAGSSRQNMLGSTVHTQTWPPRPAHRPAALPQHWATGW